MGFLDKQFSSRTTRDQFAQIVLRELANRGVTGARYDKEGFAIHVSSGTKVLFLENTYANYCKGDKRQRAEALARLTAAKPAIPKDYATVGPNLMPIVRDASRSSLAELNLRSRGVKDLKPTLFGPLAELAEGLVTMLAYDTEHSIMQLTQESFSHWGVPFKEAFATAVQNLREKTDTRLLVETEPGVYRSRWGDGYDSSRVLLTDLIYRLSLDGDPVAFLPNRDQLWITGQRNTQALESFIEAAEETHYAAHALSARLYLLEDGRWCPYLPKELRLRTLCLNLIRVRAAVDYDRQKNALQAIHARTNTDIFVAEYRLYKREDGTLFSQTLWSAGVDSLLPEADELALGIDPPAENFLMVPWELAFPLLQDLMEREEGLAPVRYRVRTFPGADRIAKLRMASAAANM